MKHDISIGCLVTIEPNTCLTYSDYTNRIRANSSMILGNPVVMITDIKYDRQMDVWMAEVLYDNQALWTVASCLKPML